MYFVCIHLPGWPVRTEEIEDCDAAVKLAMLAIDAGAKVNCGKCNQENDETQ